MSSSNTPQELEKEFDFGQVFHKSDSLVYREVAGESILIPMRGHLAQMQRLFVLNGVGAHIWKLLDGRNDLETILYSLVETFEVTPEEARADLVEYMGALRSAGLVQDEAEPADGEVEEPAQPSSPPGTVKSGE